MILYSNKTESLIVFSYFMISNVYDAAIDICCQQTKRRSQKKKVTHDKVCKYERLWGVLRERFSAWTSGLHILAIMIGGRNDQVIMGN